MMASSSSSTQSRRSFSGRDGGLQSGLSKLDCIRRWDETTKIEGVKVRGQCGLECTYLSALTNENPGNYKCPKISYL